MGDYINYECYNDQIAQSKLTYTATTENTGWTKKSWEEFLIDSNHVDYWIASQFIYAYEGGRGVSMRIYILCMLVSGTPELWTSNNGSEGGSGPVRPVVILKSDINLVADETAENTWNIE